MTWLALRAGNMNRMMCADWLSKHLYSFQLLFWIHCEYLQRKYFLFPLMEEFSLECHKSNNHSSGKSRTCAIIGDLIDSKGLQCWPGFDAQKNIPQSKEANESAKLSRAIGIWHYAKTRVTESWLVLMPHLIGWEVGPSFPSQYSAGQSRTYAITDYFLSLDQKWL